MRAVQKWETGDLLKKKLKCIKPLGVEVTKKNPNNNNRKCNTMNVCMKGDNIFISSLEAAKFCQEESDF